MNKLLLLIFGISIICSCSKNKNDDHSITTCTGNPKTYSDSSGASIALTKESWLLIKNEDGGGSVDLMLAGSTNGDSAKLTTAVDGLISLIKIDLDVQKKFDMIAEISFSHGHVQEGEFNSSTNIIVYKGTDSLNVFLQSCTLRY
jgi:hypothetical protein